MPHPAVEHAHAATRPDRMYRVLVRRNEAVTELRLREAEGHIAAVRLPRRPAVAAWHYPGASIFAGERRDEKQYLSLIHI